MKVRSALKLMCKHCYAVTRKRVRFVYCKETPKHKQRQGFHTAAQEEFVYCSSCTGSETSSNVTSFFPVSLGSVNPVADFSKMSISGSGALPKNETNVVRVIPAAGIYSIL